MAASGPTASELGGSHERSAPSAGLGRIVGSPLLVAAVVLALYGAWLGEFVAPDATRQAQVGTRFLGAGKGDSAAIDALAADAVGPVGYDGQFALYIALAPFDASGYLDDPSYRYGRPFYPVVARAIALGRPAAVPWTLILVNILAAGGLTFCAAAFLRRRGVSAWYALIVGLTPGLYVAVARDLTEPLAYALAAAGMLIVTAGRRGSVVAAGLAFGAAGLSRESALLFAFAAAICLAVGRDERGVRRVAGIHDAAILAALSCAPLLALKLGLGLGVPGSPAPPAVRLEHVPFRGIALRSPFGSVEAVELISVVVPAVLAACLVLLVTRRVGLTALALVLNVVGLVVLLPEQSYEHLLTSSRIALGVPLAFVLCLPLIRSPRARLVVAAVPTSLWMLAWLSVAPF